MGTPEEDPIVLSYHDSLLKRSDVALLEGPHWLNDQIISFFFEYLTRDVHKDNGASLLFVSPEVTQCLKMFSSNEVAMFLDPLNAREKRVVFFALNDMAQKAAGGSHWSLLVWCQPTHTFYHFDSSTPSNRDVAQEMADRLKAYLGHPEATMKESKCLQQINSFDCGIHVIAQTEFLAKHVAKSPDFPLDSGKMVQRQAVTHKREEIASLIETLAERQQ